MAPTTRATRHRVSAHPPIPLARSWSCWEPGRFEEEMFNWAGPLVEAAPRIGLVQLARLIILSIILS